MVCKGGWLSRHQWGLWKETHRLDRVRVASYYPGFRDPVRVGQTIYQERQCAVCGLKQFTQDKVGVDQ